MDLATQMAYALLLAIPVACIAWTVTQEEISRDLREAAKSFQKRKPRSLWRAKLAYLTTCPYCFSHYVAAAFVLLLQFKMLSDSWPGYVVSLFSVVLIANFYVSLYHLLRVALRAAKALADKEQAQADHFRMMASFERRDPDDDAPAPSRRFRKPTAA